MSAPEASRSPETNDSAVSMSALEQIELERAQRLIAARLTETGVLSAIMGLPQVELPPGRDLRVGVYRFVYPPATSPTIDAGVFFFQSEAPDDITRVTMYRRWGGTGTVALGFEGAHVAELHDIYDWLDLERTSGDLPNLM